MPKPKQPAKPKALPKPLLQPPDGGDVIKRVLAKTRQDVQTAKDERAALNVRLIAKGKKPKAQVKESLSFAIYFAKYMSGEVASSLVAFDSTFDGVRSGENISQAARGPKRLDINYSTPESGLGLAMSFKSVHFGESKGGDADFTHNMKRNDEELRVEATEHHLRQPYSVFVGVMFLPFESCTDSPTSSFGSWVEYLWPLKGRVTVEDPPDQFELVFVALYARDGSEFGFYEVGGDVGCPRHGKPSRLLTLTDFLRRVKSVYDKRNGKDFFFEGEKPTS